MFILAILEAIWAFFTTPATTPADIHANHRWAVQHASRVEIVHYETKTISKAPKRR